MGEHQYPRALVAVPIVWHCWLSLAVSLGGRNTTRAFPNTSALQASLFDGQDTMKLRYWFDWWRDPARRQDGEEEAGRRPDVEAARVFAELEARHRTGKLRKPPGGLKEAMTVEIRFLPQ